MDEFDIERARVVERVKHRMFGEAIYRAEVLGPPETQGSKSPPITLPNGKVVVIENNKKGRSYRQEMIREMRLDRPDRPIDDAVEMTIKIYVKRPKGHYRSGGKSHLLKPSSPLIPRSGRDNDKVARLIDDAAKIAEWITDDARVADLIVKRRFVEFDETERTVVEMQSLAGTVGETEKKVDLFLPSLYDQPEGDTDDEDWSDILRETR